MKERSKYIFYVEGNCVIVDGAGTFITLDIGGVPTTVWETESIYDCNYPDNFKTLYKHIGANGPVMGAWMPEFSSEMYDEDKDQTHELVISENAGIVKAYEAFERKAEIAAITNNSDAATFENTIVAMEKAGQELDRKKIWLLIA